LAVEINISSFGLWLLIGNTEYFVPYDKYPWFQNATLLDIYNFEVFNGKQLHWPTLDVDIDVDCLENPHKYPLIAKH
jgi:hypothetical protein